MFLKISLGVVKDSSGRVLIIKKRKQEKGADASILKWAFPGGKIEDGENEKQAVEREVLEETGYFVKADFLISSRKHPQFPVEVFYFSCLLVDGEKFVRKEGIDEEIEEVKWVDPKAIKKYLKTDLDGKVAFFLSDNKF